ncbi:MAG TPA: HEAT repeat domain-containing protein, partial [Acidobacteriota bacterium]|nr:HEAT repeat domain-containing protein [Acidobacteriota bacterium]
ELLIKALGDGTWDARKAAAKALAKLGEARALEPLIKALGDHDKDVRKAAAKGLRTLGEPQWLELVKGDDDDFERLGESKDARAVEPMIKALGDGEVSVRWAAAEALGKLGDARAVEPLIKALGDGEGSVRRAAAEALGNLGDDRAVEPLIKALGREGSVRRVSAEALGKLGDVRAVEPLIKALGDGEGSVRLAAAEALSTLSELRWAEWVKGDDEDFTRLSLSGESNAVELLLIALGDANRDVRLAAAEAMRALDEPQWSEWIKGDSNDFERLGESGDPRAVGLLVRALKNEDMDIVEEAVAALRKIKPMEAEQLILENVDSIQRGIHRIKKFLRHEIFLTDYKLWLHKIVQILKSEGMLASNTLAKLILTLLDCRNPDIWVVLDVSGEMPPTSELIDAVVKVAEAEGLTSIIPQNMPYLSEIVGQGKIGWTDETEERIKSVANRVLKQLARK